MGSISKLTKKLPGPLKKLTFYIIPFRWRYGGKYREMENFLGESQWWTRQELFEYQSRQLEMLLQHAYDNVPYYTKVFNNLKIKPKDIHGISDLKKLPVMTKEIIRNNFDDLKARNISSSEIITLNTSGSTGKPLSFWANKSIYQVEAAFISRTYASHGSDLYGENSVWLRRYTPKKGDPFFKYDPELKRLYLTPFYLSKKSLDRYINLIDSFGAKVLSGYPSSIYILALLLEETGKKLKNIKIAHATSEHMLRIWKRKIEEIMGIPVKEHYGMVEKVSLFHQCSVADLFHENLEYGVTEIDKSGVVIGTGFANYAMPFIRYRTADMARINSGEQTCFCGRGLPLTVKEFLGRSYDLLTTSDGSYIPGVNFYVMMGDIVGVNMFKIIQHSKKMVEILVVPSSKYEKSTQSQILSGMVDRMGKGVKFSIKLVDEIPRNKKTGKIRSIENLTLINQ